MKIERLDRIALGVRDLDETAAFFEGLLGIRFDAPLSHDKLGMEARYSREGLELVAGHPGSIMAP